MVNGWIIVLKYKKDTAGERPASTGGFLGGLGAGIGQTLDVGNFSTGTSEKRKVHPIQFLNYKDNIKYDCVPVDFTLTKSKDSPMLYNYEIRLRAYNLRNVNASGIKDSPSILDNNLAKLGLDGLESQSLFSSMSAIAGDASTLISAVL